VGVAKAENLALRPEIDIRITGDALGLAGGVSSQAFAYDLLRADLKYVIMASNKQDNKLQLGVALDIIQAMNKSLKTEIDTKDLSFRVGVATDLLDNLNVKYYAGAFLRF
jgi:hypothetical protein